MHYYVCTIYVPEGHGHLLVELGEVRAWLLVAELGHADDLVVVADGEAEDVARLEAGLAVAARVEQRVVVHVVDVDQLARAHHVTHDTRLQRQPHLALL